MLKDAVGQPPLTWLTCGKAPDAQYLTARSAKERASGMYRKQQKSTLQLNYPAIPALCCDGELSRM